MNKTWQTLLAQAYEIKSSVFFVEFILSAHQYTKYEMVLWY